ncbi:MAG TPA: hypothetical protein VFR58_09080 [Flavisolibacter sp.]|nr:hypothetical protein [Flavisolibacter sp.]
MDEKKTNIEPVHRENTSDSKTGGIGRDLRSMDEQEEGVASDSHPGMGSVGNTGSESSDSHNTGNRGSNR